MYLEAEFLTDEDSYSADIKQYSMYCSRIGAAEHRKCDWDQCECECHIEEDDL